MLARLARRSLPPLMRSLLPGGEPEPLEDEDEEATSAGKGKGKKGRGKRGAASAKAGDEQGSAKKKRPLTGYLLFGADERLRIKAADPELAPPMVMK